MDIEQGVAPRWINADDPPTMRQVAVSSSPTVVFLLVNAIRGIIPAIVGASLVAAGLIMFRHRRGRRAGWLLPVMLAYVSIRGIAAVWTESDDVFFGFGIAAGAGLALVVLATAFTESPVGVHAVPIFVRYEMSVRAHPLYRRVAAHITAVWALCELGVTGWEAWHLRRVSATEFVALRTLVGWPLMAVVVFLLVFYVRFRLDPLAHQLASSPDPGPRPRGRPRPGP